MDTAPATATAPRDAGDVLAAVRRLLDDLGRGVTDGTALPALSVPTRTTTVPVQENR
ncbi:hypothetical protein [Actinoallomurus rhizosphaericola]|uniref:hypothetical protein n=1 Tax=Actinoallomurus rhizosphaericola TaxID=2952536 RepID=UPI0020927C6B|nr:hypothetical protein [Actinoallomurus rhizosphaericola]MCO5997942.1 hypothetical protein [Actinoallomurus rhizosphaericola]